jgi:hypothetical protein
MSRTTAVLVVTSLLAGALVSCEKSPTRPTPPPSGGSPTPTPTPVVQSLRIDGPAQVAPGGTAQYTATGQMSDGSSRDMTSSVTWRSPDSGVLSITSGGAATAGRAGQVSITASANNRSALFQVLVLPPNTYRLTGLVREAGLPVAGATVEVVRSSTPLSSTTDGGGTYRLFGVAGDVEIRAAKDGYNERVNRLIVSSNTTSDFELTQATRNDVFGSYELTVTASPGCPASGSRALPPDVRSRTYAATITQDGPRLNVTLSGATLMNGSFAGRVEPSTVSFDLRGVSTYYGYYYYFTPFDVVDQLTASTALTLAGHVTATRSPTNISGSLEGVVAIVATPITTSPRVNASCFGQHSFVLRKIS